MPYSLVQASAQFSGSSNLQKHSAFSNLKVQKLNTSTPTSGGKYLMAGIFTIEDGKTIPGHYPGPSVLYILEGSFWLVDKATPSGSTAVSAGDVVHVEEGSEIDWSSSSGGKAFGVTYAPANYTPEDMASRK